LASGEHLSDETHIVLPTLPRSLPRAPILSSLHSPHTLFVGIPRRSALIFPQAHSCAFNLHSVV